uniref:TSL-kinase interacting protein 1 n=1 Tax=Ananas comosus var. bracteatus TaxID=296719 RepID=A0A6V7QPY7_ANACO
MKSTGHIRKATAEARSKSKLGCAKSETLKIGGRRRKTPEKATVEFCERLLPSPAQSSPLHSNTRHSSLETAPGNSTVMAGRYPQISGKFKLQLFPIDDIVRKRLEQDKHNPYLELTLTTRKKISSVVRHLNIKWGSSGTTTGELMLLPYNSSPNNMVSYKRWTLKDSDTTAADVYGALGSPAVFRLRYGWFSAQGRIPGEEMGMAKADNTPLSNNPVQAVDMSCPSLSWLDSISNMSFGALLHEALPPPDENAILAQNNPSLSQISFTCDSFDAAIASLIGCQQINNQSTQVSNSSIFNSEETCHAFQFQNITHSTEAGPSSSKDVAAASCTENQSPDVLCAPTESDGKDNMHPTDESNRDLKGNLKPHDGSNPFGRADINWPDSVGPSEHVAPCSRQMSGGDSIGLGGLVASSLDAFQNFSIF